MAGREGGKRSGDGHSEKLKRPSYVDARRYPTDEEAARAYHESQEAVRRDTGRAELSVYRIQVGALLEPHVVVLGDTPAQRLRERLELALEAGLPTTLPPEVLHHLTERRAQAKHVGSWVEGHYRPGRPIELPKGRRHS